MSEHSNKIDTSDHNTDSDPNFIPGSDLDLRTTNTSLLLGRNL